MDTKNIYKNMFMRKLNEAELMDAGPTPFDEGEESGLPPEIPEDNNEVGSPTDDGVMDAGSVSGDNGGRAFNDLRSYMDTLPQDGQVSNQQIIDLGKKYADYFREVKDTIKELQEKQLSNAFEDCLNVKFLPLSKALSNMIDELDAGVADRVHEKNVKAEKDVGSEMGV